MEAVVNDLNPDPCKSVDLVHDSTESPRVFDHGTALPFVELPLSIPCPFRQTAKHCSNSIGKVRHNDETKNQKVISGFFTSTVTRIINVLNTFSKNSKNSKTNNLKGADDGVESGYLVCCYDIRLHDKRFGDVKLGIVLKEYTDAYDGSIASPLSTKSVRIHNERSLGANDGVTIGMVRWMAGSSGRSHSAHKPAELANGTCLEVEVRK